MRMNELKNFIQVYKNVLEWWTYKIFTNIINEGIYKEIIATTFKVK